VVGEEAEMEKKVVAASELVRTAEVETEKKVMIASKSVWAAGTETEKKVVTALESVQGGGGKNEFGFLLPAIEVVAGGVTAHGRWVGGTGATVARQKHEEGGAEASDTSRQSG
jgi:hypothetical protein